MLRSSLPVTVSLSDIKSQYLTFDRWSVAYYDVLVDTVSGGKGKMFYHFCYTTGAFSISDVGGTT